MVDQDRVNTLLDFALARRKRDGFDRLNSAQQVVVMIADLDADVAINGLRGYYENSAGGGALPVVAKLDRLGLRRSADLIRRANATFPGGEPATDWEERRSQIADLSPEALSVIDECGDRFLDRPADLAGRFEAFVMAHADVIANDGSSEITTDEALAFLKSHQPMPSDFDITDAEGSMFITILHHFQCHRDERCLPLLIGAVSENTGLGMYEDIRFVLIAHGREIVAPHLRRGLLAGAAAVKARCCLWATDVEAWELADVITPLLSHEDDEVRDAADAFMELREDFS